MSLEPRENLKRAVVSIDELYPSGTVERPDGNVEGGLHGQGKHSITWYCLTCIEDLWNGVGMLQAAPHVKKDALAWSERPERILATTDTVKPYNPSAGTLSYDVDSSHRQAPRSPEALKKKAKIFLRPPCEPTSTIVAKSPPTLMDDDNIRMGVKRAPQKVEPSPQRFLSTRTKRPTAKARDAQDAAKRSPSAALNQHNHLKKPASIRTSDATVPRNDLTATDQPAAPTIGLDLGLSLSIDGAVDDDMPPPRPWRQKGPPRTSILRAAAQVGAMVTDEEEREAALLAIPDRHQADSSVITPRGVPPGNQYPAEGPMTPSSKYNTRGAATRTPGTNNSRRVTTPRPAIKAARPTTPTHSRLITDGGYVTEASANEPEHTADGPLVRSSQTIQERLRRQREVEKILREVESKKTYAAKAKKRKFMDDTVSSSLEPASHFRIQSPAHKCARLQARDANGKFLPKTEDLDADVPTLPSSRVMSLSRRLKRDLDKDSSQNKKFHIPEYWCICHQPDDELGMIQCDGEFCLVGWFHLKCTGLAMVPDEGGISHLAPFSTVSHPLTNA